MHAELRTVSSRKHHDDAWHGLPAVESGTKPHTVMYEAMCNRSMAGPGQIVLDHLSSSAAQEGLSQHRHTLSPYMHMTGYD